MAIPAASILLRAGTILQDTTSVRWPVSELVQWFNDAQREIVLFKPESSVVNKNLLLTASDTKQTLPSEAIRLIDVVRNTGANGTTYGSAVRLVQREVLDAQRPGWHGEPGDSTIKHFMFDQRDPKTFYVYPRPSSSPAVNLEVVYSVAPTDVDSACTFTDVGDTVGVASHGLTAGTPVIFPEIASTTGVSAGTVYYVVNPLASTFQVALVPGGAAIALTTNGTGRVTRYMGLDDIYSNAVLDYCLYRSYSKDAEYAANAQRAAAHYQQFAQSIGIRATTDTAINPATNSVFNPNMPRMTAKAA